MENGETSAEATGSAPVIGAASRLDSALALVTSIASAVPVLGGPAASVVVEIRRNFDRRQAARLAAVVDELASRLERLDDRIERDLGQDGEFASFLEAAIESASSARNAEKRRFYVALMARSATVDGPERIQRTLLLDTLDRVRHTHLALLHAVAAGPAPNKPSDYYTEGTPESLAIREALPSLDLVLLHRLWEDMVALGLLVSWTDYIVSETSLVEDPGDSITQYGHAFLRFISPF